MVAFIASLRPLQYMSRDGSQPVRLARARKGRFFQIGRGLESGAKQDLLLRGRFYFFFGAALAAEAMVFF